MRRQAGRGATLRDTLSDDMLKKLGELRSKLDGTTKASITSRVKVGSAYSAKKKNLAKKQLRTGVDSRDARSTVAIGQDAPVASATKRPASVDSQGTPVSQEVHPSAFEWWALPQGAAVREVPPSHISDEDRTDFLALLAAGGDDDGQDGQELFAVVGLDFGTSSTKVVVRFPYEAGEPTVAIPAPSHCVSDGQPHLWQTVLWLRTDGEFIAWPEPEAVLLHALKQGAMSHGAEQEAVPGQYRGLAVSRIDAAAAYLANVVRYTRGWLRTHRPNLFRGRSTRWLLNLGLPSETADNDQLSSTYREVATTALLCANLSERVDIETTKLLLTEAAVVAAGKSQEAALDLGIGVFPETVAEAVGFSKSNLASLDLYLMVDVGASTLDVCTFRLHSGEQGEDQYALQCGMVRPLGVEAMHWFFGEGRTEAAFRKQCDRSLRSVLWTTRTTKDANARGWQAGNDLPVFLVGGGANNALHREIVEELTPWLQRHTKSNGIRLVQLPVPSQLDASIAVADFGRLAVAWGLSYPDDEIGVVMPPSLSTDVPLLEYAEGIDRFVSKDLV